MLSTLKLKMSPHQTLITESSIIGASERRLAKTRFQSARISRCFEISGDGLRLAHPSSHIFHARLKQEDGLQMSRLTRRVHCVPCVECAMTAQRW